MPDQYITALCPLCESSRHCTILPPYFNTRSLFSSAAQPSPRSVFLCHGKLFITNADPYQEHVQNIKKEPDAYSASDSISLIQKHPITASPNPRAPHIYDMWETDGTVIPRRMIPSPRIWYFTPRMKALLSFYLNCGFLSA